MPELRFMFHLAERLGRTVGELEGAPPGRGMSETEFEHWKALSRIEAEEAAKRR